MTNFQFPVSNFKIALAHDSFTQDGGAERVMEGLHELFPQAPVFTLVFDPKFREKYKDWDIRTSKLQTLYLSLGKLQYLLPLIPYGVDSLDFSGFDVIISSSSGFIKNLRRPKNALHINYCHTPARFLWSDANYVNEEVNPVFRPAAKFILNRIKLWDLKGAKRVDYFIANSHEVQNRISRYYQRTSTLIHPFVDMDFWKNVQTRQNYFLLAGRLQAHKNNELIIQIFNELDLPLRVAGTGRQENYLKSIAKPNIKFLGRVSDEQLRQEYSGALGFIYPQLEDFGLMPLEAAACGTATLAYGKGGALETVTSGVTGEFFGPDAVSPFMGCGTEQTADKLANYKDQIKQLILNWQPQKYKPDQLQSQAEKFSKEKFKENILEFINSLKMK